MANSYVKGKWAGTLEADLVSDGTKTTPTLGDNFDLELKNLTEVKKTIDAKIKAIKKQVTALKNHAETGKMAADYLKTTEKRLDKMNNALATEVNTVSNAVSKAQRDEWLRMKRILEEWYAQQQQGN